MPRSAPLGGPDSLVKVSDYALVERLGDQALLGNWFAFLKPEWLARSGLDTLLATTLGDQLSLKPRAAIFFRGQELTLPGATIAAKKIPGMRLFSLTSDKALYRLQSDTVRLLLAAPLQANEKLKLQLKLNGNSYAEYTVLLDEYGLALWSMQGLPEGTYEASVQDSDVCRFEVAEYRLALLNAELLDQRVTPENDVLHYTLGITAVGQPYTGSVEIEVQARGVPIGSRAKKQCDEKGQCHGVFRLKEAGPYTLNIYAGERTATVALKGSEQERREVMTISDLGEIYRMSLLPLPDSQECRGMHVARSGQNNEPFLVRSVVGSEIELTARVAVDMLRVVLVDPARGEGKYDEYIYEQLLPEQSLKLPVPSPYGLVLLGALLDGKPWEGWCAVLRPSDLQLDCQVPDKARPGDRVTIRLKTNASGRNVPVHLIVKDQRLIAPGDPQLELAACIKKNLASWDEDVYTGEITRKLMDAGEQIIRLAGGVYSGRPFPLPPPSAAMPMPAAMPRGRLGGVNLPLGAMAAPLAAASSAVGEMFGKAAGGAPAATATLTKVRMQFPEVIYNSLLKVDGETDIEIKLGDSMTRYSVEAFALDPETLDWQRAETSIEAVQTIYGELTVSPFVYPGDPIMGRLDVGAASGTVLVEVRHDDEPLPLFYEDGRPVSPGEAISSGSVLRFPIKPGMVTAIVRDAHTGEADVSERYISEPGKLRHITRRLRLLTPGEEVDLSQAGALEIKPMPGLERPFQIFVEGAAAYPFGCVEQTSCKLMAMFAGYITNLNELESARKYEAVIPIWYKRLKSMYLPQSGFCMYPPEEGGKRSPDTYYAPKAIKHLLKLPDAQGAALAQPALREILDDIAAMVKDAAAYYKIEAAPRKVTKCEEAYQVLRYSDSPTAKSAALSFVRSHIVSRNGQTLIENPEDAGSRNLWGAAVSQREETAYGAAALLLGGEAADLLHAVAATNYLTGQLNEEGRLYSTIDTEACLVLLLALREAGIVTSPSSGRVALNGLEMSLADAFSFAEKLTSIRVLQGIVAVQITSEIIEDWGTFRSEIPVEVRLEQKGRVQNRYAVGDAPELVIRIPHYEPGLLVHVCLPDALARIVGGGQVKRFTLDFCEKNELRIPLAVVGSTILPDDNTARFLQLWTGFASKKEENRSIQHWAVLVRNMFKEEQAGNPGILEVRID